MVAIRGGREDRKQRAEERRGGVYQYINRREREGWRELEWYTLVWLIPGPGACLSLLDPPLGQPPSLILGASPSPQHREHPPPPNPLPRSLCFPSPREWSGLPGLVRGWHKCRNVKGFLATRLFWYHLGHNLLLTATTDMSPTTSIPYNVIVSSVAFCWSSRDIINVNVLEGNGGEL